MTTASEYATNVPAIVDVAQMAAKPTTIDVEEPLHVVLVPEGARVERIEVDVDKHRDFPRRRKGTVRLHDAASFARYVLKHRDEDMTEVYADVTKQSVVAVLNDHGPDVAGWGDHRAELVLTKTDAWKRWEALNGKLGDQITFAEHLEDSLADIVSPPAADLLELAQSFQANISVKFESARRVNNGERQLVYREDVAASAGRTGDITIPETFTIGVAPFEGCDAYRIDARLRYRLRDGALSIGYVLDRPEDVLRTAFLDSVAAIEGALGFDVARGEAPAAR